MYTISRFRHFQDKRKLQEEITQRRLKVEEEKLKHQHLKVRFSFLFFFRNVCVQTNQDFVMEE